MKFKNWLLAAAATFSAACLLANPSDDFFQKGNADSQRGDFAAAAKNYESALAAADGRRVSAEVFSNLAQAYFQQKQFARAILNFERALLLAPADQNLQNDLDLARRRAGIEPEKRTALASFFEKILSSLPPNFWAVAALFFAWLSAAGVFFIFKKKEKLGRRLAIGSSTFFAVALIFALQTAVRQSGSQAGIVLSETAVHPAPDGSTDILENLRPGEKVRLVESLSGWWKIRLSSGGTAWVAGSSVEKI